MGDLRASARAVQLGGGFPLFNHSLIMAVTQLSGFSLQVTLMESSVSDEVPSSRPMLYHFTLAAQTLSRTVRRSAILREAAEKRYIVFQQSCDIKDYVMMCVFS